MALQLWETLKESITAYTGLSPATFFTVLALGLTLYYVVSSLFGSSDGGHAHDRSRGFEEQLEPLPPPVQLGEITAEELKLYDGSNSEKPLLMAIKGQIYDVTQSRFCEARIMEDEYSAIRRWEDMDIDILVEIFQRMNIYELTSGVAHVCHTWRMAACDPLLWKTLDLSLLKSNFIKIKPMPYVYVDGPSDKTFERVLNIALNLSRESTLTMIFHFNTYVSDSQLRYAAERCPRLKRLVMPSWNRITKTVICQAVKMWGDLESLTMPSISDPPYLMEEISRSCKNFAQLKVMGSCNKYFASTLAKYLPNLKVLSLRCSVLFKDALIIILESMPGLEVLNISHCLLMEVLPQPAPRRVLKALDKSILERASRLKKFVTCMSESCTMCQWTRNDEGLIRWSKYEEDIWNDEVSSLAI